MAFFSLNKHQVVKLGWHTNAWRYIGLYNASVGKEHMSFECVRVCKKKKNNDIFIQII